MLTMTGYKGLKYCKYYLLLNLKPPDNFPQKHFPAICFIHCTMCPYLVIFMVRFM